METTIFRSFEYHGKRYIHGYGARFDSPDNHGTVMTREVVEESIEKALKKFPTVRYMHQKPFAQILFDREIDGIKTHVDNIGFYILAEVYPEAEAEWQMVKKGHWGLSWSMAPTGAKTETRRASDGNYYPHFVKGLIREISVVDAPSHLECEAMVMQRMYSIQQPEIRTMENFEEIIIHSDGTRSFPESPPKPEKPEIPKEIMLKRNFEFKITPHPPFPEICDKSCPYITCSSWNRPDAVGKPCRNLVEKTQKEKT
jgi:phage head maturation protease